MSAPYASYTPNRNKSPLFAGTAATRYTRTGRTGQEDALTDQQLGYGDTAEGTYLNNAKNFDAQQGLDTYARGAYSTISDQLGRQLDQLKGSAVGAGRLDTGFYDKDQGQLVRSANQDFSNALAGQAINAQGQQLQSNQGLAQFGESATGTGADLLTARRQELEDEYQQDQARKRQSGLGGLAKGLVGAAASFIPGIGGAIGKYLGS